MENLEIKLMEPEANQSLLREFFSWLQSNWFQMGILGLVWRAISLVFKYFSQSRDDRIRKIVKEEMIAIGEDINSVDKKLDTLMAVVYERLARK